MKYSGKLLSKEEREYQYGWISNKYSTALACLAGDEVEIKDGIDARPPKPDTYVPFEPEVSLSVEDIIDIHNKMVDDFGGEYGIRDEGLLESSIRRSWIKQPNTYSTLPTIRYLSTAINEQVLQSLMLILQETISV